METVFIDTEVYPNFFCICMESSDGKKFSIQMYGEDVRLASYQVSDVRRILENNVSVGFNSIKYDLPILERALERASARDLYQTSRSIVVDKQRIWCNWDIQHIDINEPNPAVFVGLKELGARMHTREMESLPYPPDQRVTVEQSEHLHEYCWKDIRVTKELYEAIKPRLDIRESMVQKYGWQVMSKSDAQIAEFVIKRALNITGRPSGSLSQVRYVPPKQVSFVTAEMKRVLEVVRNARFMVSGGKVQLPSEIASLKPFGIQMGVGGLHSCEENRNIVCKGDEVLVDADVTSYYPSIILRDEVFPEYIGQDFLRVYRSIMKQRLIAKREGNKTRDYMLKILLSGLFGKLSSPYSSFYSPKSLLHITMTGQLSLLMLVERLKEAGLSVESANTDGVVTKLQHEGTRYYGICDAWEEDTGFSLDFTKYRALYSESVNSYLAVKMDGTTKGKGTFADEGLQKSPNGAIIHEAVKRYLVSGERIEETIANCLDVRKFLFVRKCKEGAHWRGDPLGTIVRWYLSTDGEAIRNPNGHKVARSDYAKPAMNLPEGCPGDIYLQKYVEMAYDLLKRVGVRNDVLAL